MIMTSRKMFLSVLALGACALWSALCLAQEPGKNSDDALDSLLQKLEKADKAVQESKPADEGTSPGKDDKPSEAKPKAPTSTPAPGGEAKPSDKESAGKVSAKDKEIDELLEKLGETKDQPSPDERRPGGAANGEPPKRPGSGGPGKEKSKDKEKAPGLQGKDKDLDERLEELTGRKKKRNNRERGEGGGGPLGQIIKEMRDVEQRLGKPETGGDTQARQKKIVKDIETLIQQMRQSGGSSGSMALRMVRQAGQKPGGQQGQQPGSTAGGAPAQKPAKPSDHHAMAGGKDIWGHLPAELRQEMENVFKEEPLSAKMDLIRRYYLSVAKQKLVRGE